MTKDAGLLYVAIGFTLLCLIAATWAFMKKKRNALQNSHTDAGLRSSPQSVQTSPQVQEPSSITPSSVIGGSGGRITGRNTAPPPPPPPLPPPLPPRRQRNPLPDHLRRLSGKPGPRGIQPVQFPCCPIDRQRNKPGEPQKIFWDKSTRCYICSRNHRFRKNGTLC